MNKAHLFIFFQSTSFYDIIKKILGEPSSRLRFWIKGRMVEILDPVSILTHHSKKVAPSHSDFGITCMIVMDIHFFPPFTPRMPHTRKLSL